MFSALDVLLFFVSRKREALIYSNKKSNGYSLQVAILQYIQSVSREFLNKDKQP